jgi:hypothetical protein
VAVVLRRRAERHLLTIFAAISRRRACGKYRTWIRNLQSKITLTQVADRFYSVFMVIPHLYAYNCVHLVAHPELVIEDTGNALELLTFLERPGLCNEVAIDHASDAAVVGDPVQRVGLVDDDSGILIGTFVFLEYDGLDPFVDELNVRFPAIIAKLDGDHSVSCHW